MFGPKPIGHWSENASARFGPLRQGQRYRVYRTFADFHGTVHEPGEEWVFLGSRPLPHDDGVLLYVSLDVEQEWHIRLQPVSGIQRQVIEAIDQFVRAVAKS